MGESKYTMALLLGACVVLIFAIVLTWVDVAEYKGAPAGPVSRGRTVQPQPEETGGETAQQEQESEAPAETEEGEEGTE
jgi:hypothetical protein